MSVHAEFIKNISKKIKALFPDIRLIVGGIHPTSLLKKSIDEFEYVDIFVIGEGEITLLEILKNYKKEKIKGIAFKKGKKVITNLQREFIQNLDELPFPARNMLPSLENYKLGFDWEGRTPATTIFTSRGCPFNCIYCASKVMWKRKVRFRSAENVLKEIDFLVKKYKIREILFYDDHFTLNKKRLLEICEGLIKRKYDLTWCCLSRVDSIDFETAEVMKRAGCHMIPRLSSPPV